MKTSFNNPLCFHKKRIGLSLADVLCRLMENIYSLGLFSNITLHEERKGMWEGPPLLTATRWPACCEQIFLSAATGRSILLDRVHEDSTLAASLYVTIKTGENKWLSFGRYTFAFMHIILIIILTDHPTLAA